MLHIIAIDNFEQIALEGSVFDDYGTMLLMRIVGSVIFAILLLLLVFYPLYALLWRFLRRKFPAVGENFYLKRHKKKMQDQNDYDKYLKWAKNNGYKPVVKRGK